MKNAMFRLFVFAAIAASLAVTTGCQRNKGSADLYGSDNLYGEDIMDGDMVLNDLDGLTAEGDRSVVEPVFFPYDSSSVNPEEAGKCEEVANLLNKNKWKGVIVEGHGDERGSRDYNLALGERRALAVRDYLINLGVDPANIQTKSFGEELPDNMGHDEGAWRQNRRAVFAMY